MSERYSEEEIDRLLNAAYCPSMPLKGVVRQLRADLAINVRAIHELQAGAARDREEIVKLREALRWALEWAAVAVDQLVSGPEAKIHLSTIEQHRKLLGEGEK